MARKSVPVRILAALAALMLFALTAGSAFAVVDDFAARETMPAGATVDGHELDGLSRDEARILITEQVARPLAGPISVVNAGRTFTLDAASLTKVDVDGMITAAFKPKATSSLPERVRDRALTAATGASVKPQVAVDEASLNTWLDGVASSVDTAPVDASMAVEGTSLRVVASKRGERVDRAAAITAITAALQDGTKTLTLPVTYAEPKVLEKDLGTTILVRRTQRKLWLYDHGALVKTYDVAVGTPGYPTPRGNWMIVQKRYRPTWSNPGSDWAKGMPASIGPGPGNPLGTRALNLNAPGIRIHGTSKNYSIGTAASHGCMRMHMWDVEELYDLVEVGTPVFIIN
ncbi:MAG: ErfK/YbiS/YcfS/YnhG family [Actinobacteria bacterium]|nr:MAG: ErfK/YbiS/YcfS/YnhG family [Actinomycetota bacterium]